MFSIWEKFALAYFLSYNFPVGWGKKVYLYFLSIFNVVAVAVATIISVGSHEMFGGVAFLSLVSPLKTTLHLNNKLLLSLSSCRRCGCYFSANSNKKSSSCSYLYIIVNYFLYCCLLLLLCLFWIWYISFCFCGLS